MAKGKTTVYFCQSCGYETSKWMGQCPGCHEWNTLVEEVVEKKSAGKSKICSAAESKVMPLTAITAASEERISTNIKELDRVLGGGIVRGSLVLVGGDPGKIGRAHV